MVTTNMRAGYLRKNGVPYSENAASNGIFRRGAVSRAAARCCWSRPIVEDPQYLQQPFIVSSQFKKETDGSKWDPTPCSAR